MAFFQLVTCHLQGNYTVFYKQHKQAPNCNIDLLAALSNLTQRKRHLTISRARHKNSKRLEVIKTKKQLLSGVALEAIFILTVFYGLLSNY